MQMSRITVGLLLCLVASCVAPPPPWTTELTTARVRSRDEGRDLVVFFALLGREQSDRMEAELSDPAVLAALLGGEFESLRLDGFAQQRLYSEWIGGGEGMGLAVLDPRGVVYCARPGPLDPLEVAALLDRCAAVRARIDALRSVHAQNEFDAKACLDLGIALLDLGCRVGAEPLLLQAAQGGALDAHHRLARLYALDGHCVRARQWLRTALPSPQADVTLGYVEFKERQYRKAVETLASALRQPGLGEDALRARLYLGKALHECGRDHEAIRIFQALVQEVPGTTFGAAAQHSLTHLQDGNHGHTH